MYVKFKEVEFVKKHINNTCSNCIGYKARGCAEFMEKLTGINCAFPESGIFKFKEQFVQCSADNIEVGDVIYTNMKTPYKVLMITPKRNLIAASCDIFEHEHLIRNEHISLYTKKVS